MISAQTPQQKRPCATLRQLLAIQMESPRRLATTGIAKLDADRRLIQDSFSYMETRIDPASYVREPTLDAKVRHCQTGEIWSLGTGVSRLLVEHACESARQLGHAILELQLRVELVENQAAFARLGCVKTGGSVHSGFLQPTSLTLQRRV